MSHGHHTPNAGWRSGDHWVECMRCGFDIRQSDALKQWNGLIVCKECFETRHPQELIRSIPDNAQAKGLVNPSSPDIFITVTGYSGGVQDNTIPQGTFNNEI